MPEIVRQIERFRGPEIVKRPSAVEELEATPKSKPSFPAFLKLVTRKFEEPSGNGVLDAEEDGKIILTVENQGKGEADLSIKLTPLSSMENVRFDRSISAGSLVPGESKSIEVPIHVGLDVRTAERRLRIEAIDNYYRFDAQPVEMVFNTHAFQPPHFQVRLKEIDDSRTHSPANNNNGRVDLTETIKTSLIVQNTGLGEGRNVKAKVSIGEEGQNIYFRRIDGSPDPVFDFGRMVSGEHHPVEFFFFTSSFYNRDSIRIDVEVAEERGRFGEQATIGLPVGRRVQLQEQVVIEPTQQSSLPLPVEIIGTIDIEQVPAGSKTRLEDGLAVIVGIEKYRYAPDATYKVRDAQVAYDYCRQVFGMAAEKILLRLDEDASKAEMDYIFGKDGWIEKRLKPGVTDLIIYLGGHGFPDMQSHRPYFIPYDVRPEQATNGISLEELYAIIASFRPKSATVFIESCFSGVGSSGEMLAADMNPVLPVIESWAAVLQAKDFVVFTAASEKQASSNSDRLKHGIFTYFVLKGLGGSADRDGDQKVTVGELYQYVLDEVPRVALNPPLDRQQAPTILPPVSLLGERGKRVLVEY